MVSEVDQQEVRNALDQARREVATRFDFKGTGSAIDHEGAVVTLRSSSEGRLEALVQVLQEKLVRRNVSLKALEFAKVEEAAKGTVRQAVTIRAGISGEHAKSLTKLVRDLRLKNVTAQIQGEQVRVTGKKKDDLQAVIAALRAADFELPLQFTNFRD
ncbi:MAG: YajQ family cyclic di-GMP-binding protein [Acidimicrobiales bacterium]